MGRLVSINVGVVRTVEHHGRIIQTGIWKEPVMGPIELQGTSVTGDQQADIKAHGGNDKAIYAYAIEDYEWWQAELHRPLGPGNFGENLTTSEVDVNDARVGERWRVGTALLEVSEPRIPCFKLGLRMADPRFPRQFGLAVRPGAYLRILEPGTVAAGSDIDVVHRPESSVTISDIAYIFNRHRADAHRLLAVESLSQAWIDWAEQILRLRAQDDLNPGPPPN